MERTNSIETSAQHKPAWGRVLVTLLAGVAVFQWTLGPLMAWLRPDATEAEVYLVVKGVTFAFVAAVVMRTTGWAAVGLRRPIRPASALYGTPCLLLGAMALAQGVASTWTPGTFVVMLVWLTVGVLVEEILFRGAMWEAVASRGHLFTAITTSVGFGTIHLLGIGGQTPTSVVLSQVCFAIGTGLVLAAVRIVAGTLWTAVAVHWVFNLMSFIPTGGVAATLSPGMEVQILSAGVVLALIGLGLVVLASRRSDSGPTVTVGSAHSFKL